MTCSSFFHSFRLTVINAPIIHAGPDDSCVLSYSNLEPPLTITSASIDRRPIISQNSTGHNGHSQPFTEHQMVMELMETFTHRELSIDQSMFRHFRDFVRTEARSEFSDLESEYIL